MVLKDLFRLLDEDIYTTFDVLDTFDWKSRLGEYNDFRNELSFPHNNFALKDFRSRFKLWLKRAYPTELSENKVSSPEIDLETIKKHLIAGEIKTAIEVLLSQTKNSPIEKNVILLAQRFRYNENEKTKYIISNENYLLERNQIVNALLEIVKA